MTATVDTPTQPTETDGTGQRRESRLLTARRSLFWVLLMRQRRRAARLVAFAYALGIASYEVTHFAIGFIDGTVVNQAQAGGVYLAPLLIWSIVGAVAVMLCVHSTRKMAYGMDLDLRVWLYTRLLSIAPDAVDADRVERLIDQAQAEAEMLSELVGLLPVVVVLLPVGIGAAVNLFITNVLFGAEVVGVLLAGQLAAFFVRSGIRDATASEMDERSQARERLDDAIRRLERSERSEHDDVFQAEIAEISSRIHTATFPRARALAWADVCDKFLVVAGEAAVIILGGHLIAGAHLLQTKPVPIGDYYVAVAAALVFTLLCAVTDDWSAARAHLGQMQERLLPIFSLGAPPSLQGRPLAVSPTGFTLRDVVVSGMAAPGTHRVDVDVPAGEMALITGPERCGRSRLALVAAGLAQPAEGQVLLDGIILGEFRAFPRRRAVPVGDRETCLFRGQHSGEPASQCGGHRGRRGDLGGHPCGRDGFAGRRATGQARSPPDALSYRVHLGGSPTTGPGPGALGASAPALILDDAFSALTPDAEAAVITRIRGFGPQVALVVMSRRSLPLDTDRRLDLGTTALGESDLLATAAILDRVDLPDLDRTGKAADGSGAVVDSPARPDQTCPNWWATARPSWRFVATAGLLTVLQAIAVLAPIVIFGHIVNIARSNLGQINFLGIDRHCLRGGLRRGRRDSTAGQPACNPDDRPSAPPTTLSPPRRRHR